MTVYIGGHWRILGIPVERKYCEIIETLRQALKDRIPISEWKKMNAAQSTYREPDLVKSITSGYSMNRIIGSPYEDAVDYIVDGIILRGERPTHEIKAMVETILKTVERQPCSRELEYELLQAISPMTLETTTELEAIFWRRFRDISTPLFDEAVYERLARKRAELRRYISGAATEVFDSHR